MDPLGIVAGYSGEGRFAPVEAWRKKATKNRLTSRVIHWSLCDEDSEHYVVECEDVLCVISPEITPPESEYPLQAVARLLEPGEVAPTSIIALLPATATFEACVEEWVVQANCAMLVGYEATAAADLRLTGNIVGYVQKGGAVLAVRRDGRFISAKYHYKGLASVTG